MLTVADPSVLEAVEQAESQNLLPRKVIDGARTIYSSHVLGPPKDSLWGQPALCELYRAPEVLFGMDWDSSIDIWSVGTLVITE
jgi:serine/threonine-protein kinase SRPK3